MRLRAFVDGQEVETQQAQGEAPTLGSAPSTSSLVSLGPRRSTSELEIVLWHVAVYGSAFDASQVRERAEALNLALLR